MKCEMKEIGRVLVVALALVMIVTVLPVSAQPLWKATVSVDSITLAPQTSATVSVMITNATDDTDAAANISSADMNLTYDPTVVQVIQVVNGSDFETFSHNVVNGKVIMTGGSVDDLAPPVKFADVTVKAIGAPGECSPLNLEGQVYQPHGSDFHIMTFINGSVCIVTGVPVYNTFGTIALIGLLAVILAVSVKRR